MAVIPIGMRTKVADPAAIIINTCGENDTNNRGTTRSWVWSNPTNRIIQHPYEDITAVSVECLWQGTKVMDAAEGPRTDALNGYWRLGKGKRPLGAYAGPGKPLITNVGEARRKIYIPAYRRLVEHWMGDPVVTAMVDTVRNAPNDVYLRDFDTGQGVDRNGPMSHAWVLSVWLNTGAWPG